MTDLKKSQASYVLRTCMVQSDEALKKNFLDSEAFHKAILMESRMSDVTSY